MITKYDRDKSRVKLSRKNHNIDIDKAVSISLLNLAHGTETKK